MRKRRPKRKRKNLDPYASVRRAIAPPTIKHEVKNKYKRSRLKEELRKEINEWI